MTRQAHAPRRNGRTVKASLHGLRRILRPSSADQRIGRSRNEKRGAATATRRAPQATTAASTIVSWRPSGSAGNGSEGIAPVDQSVPTSDAAIAPSSRQMTPSEPAIAGRLDPGTRARTSPTLAASPPRAGRNPLSATPVAYAHTTVKIGIGRRQAQVRMLRQAIARRTSVASWRARAGTRNRASSS